MIYFTADTHFGHQNILWMCNRPFATIEEMNATLIENWNSRVKGNDTVYIIGDMFFRCKEPEPILRQLKGKKHLILGNHDGSWTQYVTLEAYFESVNTMLETTDGKRGLTICHYPMLSWRRAKQTYMIHGHIHNDTRMDFWPLLCARPHVLNAGVDINGFMPVTFEELIENNARWKERF